MAEQDGKVPGRRLFKKRTGIKNWYGLHWTSWGDALNEAGFSPNQFQGRSDKEELIKTYLDMVKEFGRVPTTATIRMKARNNPDFPGHSTFRNNLGVNSELLPTVLAYVKEKEYSADLIAILEAKITVDDQGEWIVVEANASSNGYVYLMKSGKHYKIGKTNSVDRRQYEIGLQLPEGIKPIHSIETDDPSGIEAYWHNRFKDKRLKGEWFNLTASDVRIFRKRKFM